MALYQLGPEVFTTMSRADHPAGFPELPVEHTDLHSAAGLNGVSIRRLGKKGVPFPVVTFRDCASEAVALARVTAYKQMEGEEWGMVWKDVNLLSEASVTFVVLSVGQINIQECKNGVGGVSGTSTHYVEAAWNLICTEPSS